MNVLSICFFFFFKQKTAYEMRISDWSSDVCSSDLRNPPETAAPRRAPAQEQTAVAVRADPPNQTQPSSLPIHMVPPQGRSAKRAIELNLHILGQAFENLRHQALVKVILHVMLDRRAIAEGRNPNEQRTKEHPSELQS